MIFPLFCRREHPHRSEQTEGGGREVRSHRPCHVVGDAASVKEISHSDGLQWVVIAHLARLPLNSPIIQRSADPLIPRHTSLHSRTWTCVSGKNRSIGYIR